MLKITKPLQYNGLVFITPVAKSITCGSAGRAPSHKAKVCGSDCNHLLGASLNFIITFLALKPPHLVTKLHYAALVGFNLGQMEGNVFVNILKEWDSLTN